MDKVTHTMDSNLPGAALEVSRFGKSRRWTSLWVDSAQATQSAEHLLLDGWSILENFSAFHWDGAWVLNYFLVNARSGDHLVFRFSVPTTSERPSLAKIWPAARVQESGVFG